MFFSRLLSGLCALATIGLAVPQAFAKTEITWWHAMGGALGETVNEIAERFNAAQDDYAITPIYKGNYEETLTVTIAAFRASDHPTIVQVYEIGAATLIGSEGVLMPVEDLLRDHGWTFESDDFIPGARYFYADESGKMIGMPFNSSTPIFYYNEQALQTAGVTPPKTWEEFANVTAPALKEAGFIALSQSSLPWIFAENFHSRHNLPFATQNNGYGPHTPRLMVNNAAVKQHFSEVKRWLDEGYFGYYGAGYLDNQRPFENGDVAMWIGSSGSIATLRQTMTMPWSATFLPYWESLNPNPKNTFIGGAALWVLSGKTAAEYEAAAAFLAFQKSPEIQAYWHQATGYVPITTAAYELTRAQGYYEENPPAEIPIKQLSLPGGDWSKGYRLGFYLQIRDVMSREFGRYVSGETSLDAAFETIEVEGNRLLERFAKTQE